MFDSVRTKLTLWYACVLALSLIVFAFLVYYAAAAIFYERQDESLRSTAQTVASAYVEEFEEQHSETKAGQVLLTELAFPDRYVQIINSSGDAIAASRNPTANGVHIPAATLAEARRQRISFVSFNGLRVAVVPLSSNREMGFATVAEPLRVIETGLQQLRRDFFMGVPLVLLCASLGGYFLARKSLSPIALMNSQTRRITVEKLSSRLNVLNPRDEVGELTTTINDLLGRLERSFKEQQRFIADASHELRTPLAVLRGETEIALSRKRRVDDYERSLALIKEEAERLSRIVEDLFILARQPLDGPAELLKEELSLDRIVRECERAAEVLAQRKGVHLQLKIDSTPIEMNGDDELLKRMLLNLLDNAVKYTPRGGEILVNLARQNGHARIVVHDNGVGIPDADQPHVFDRFYRVDKARSRALGGAGLGLSIARWIVEAHGGKIEVQSTPGSGSTFTVELPLN